MARCEHLKKICMSLSEDLWGNITTFGDFSYGGVCQKRVYQASLQLWASQSLLDRGSPLWMKTKGVAVYFFPVCSWSSTNFNIAFWTMIQIWNQVIMS